MKMYKGFNSDMTCRDFQFRRGETYEEPVARLCECGFHACEHPLDVFNFYAPDHSVYHEVDLDGDLYFGSNKSCGTKITIGKRLSIVDMFKAEQEESLRNSKRTLIEDKGDSGNKSGYSCIKGGTAYAQGADYNIDGWNIAIAEGQVGTAISKDENSASLVTGRNGVAFHSRGKGIACSTNDCSSAIGASNHDTSYSFGDYSTSCAIGYLTTSCTKGTESAAFASGYNSDANADGSDSIAASFGTRATASAMGRTGVAVSCGLISAAKAAKGNVIFLVEYDFDPNTKNKIIKSFKAEMVDGVRIKENTWYTLVNGEFVETYDVWH